MGCNGLFQDDKGNTSMLRVSMFVVLCLCAILCLGGVIGMLAGADGNNIAITEGVGLAGIVVSLISKVVQKKIENK